MKNFIGYIMLGLLISMNSFAEKACCEKSNKAELLKAAQEVEQMAAESLVEEEAAAAEAKVGEIPAALTPEENLKDDASVVGHKPWSEKKKIIITRWLNSLSLNAEQEDAIIALLSPAQIEKVMLVISD